MIHFLKYNLIGVINTLITLFVAWVLHHLLGFSIEISNFLGFIPGAVNSFVMNRRWNFKSQNHMGHEALRFVLVFAVCYGVNLGVLVFLKNTLPQLHFLDAFFEYFAQIFTRDFFANIFANGVYVILSFTLFKKYVFKKRDTQGA